MKDEKLYSFLNRWKYTSNDMFIFVLMGIASADYLRKQLLHIEERLFSRNLAHLTQFDPALEHRCITSNMYQ